MPLFLSQRPLRRPFVGPRTVFTGALLALLTPACSDPPDSAGLTAGASGSAGSASGGLGAFGNAPSTGGGAGTSGATGYGGADTGGAAGAASGGAGGAASSGGSAGVASGGTASGGSAGSPSGGTAGVASGGTGGSATCVPESDAAFCARLAKNCDVVSGYDNCGKGRSANCGVCQAPEKCGDGGVKNVCGKCVPETDAQLCASGNYDCGVLNIVDRCGAQRSPSCGSCLSASEACISSSSCVSNRCSTTAEPNGTSCGTPGDVGDRRSCKGGACVNPVGYCDYVPASKGWVLQATTGPGSGTGAFYYQADCSCGPNNTLHFQGTSVPNAPVYDIACPNGCAAIGTRRVCF